MRGRLEGKEGWETVVKMQCMKEEYIIKIKEYKRINIATEKRNK